MAVSADYIYFLMLLNAAFFLHLLSFVAPLPPSLASSWHNPLAPTPTFVNPTTAMATSSTDITSVATRISAEFCPAPLPLFQEQEEAAAAPQEEN